MRLLIVTQAVDLDDPVLGFFHRWIVEFAKHFSSIEVICLRAGRYKLPGNVTVHSLGKESGGNRLLYTLRFYRYIWSLRDRYDAVFVHMNQEYILLGGLLWKGMGKSIYMWRNHYAGDVLTDIAALFCTRVFCTSKSSYTAKYRKTTLMPVGIDTETFRPVPGIIRIPRSILSLGRISPSKNIHIILQALKLLHEKGVDFTASIYGDALPRDIEYLQQQKDFVAKSGLSDIITFYPGVLNMRTPEVYSAHQIFVNASQSGMFDKTLFEAIACGCTTVAFSRDYVELVGDDYSFNGDEESLAGTIRRAIDLTITEILRDRLLRDHSLDMLASQLRQQLA